jgi:hypothetical protein
MVKKPTTKTFRLNAIIDGHLITGKVAFSPAPQPGVLTELARFEAERILAHMVREEISAARL